MKRSLLLLSILALHGCNIDSQALPIGGNDAGSGPGAGGSGAGGSGAGGTGGGAIGGTGGGAIGGTGGGAIGGTGGNVGGTGGPGGTAGNVGGSGGTAGVGGSGGDVGGSGGASGGTSGGTGMTGGSGGSSGSGGSGGRGGSGGTSGTGVVIEVGAGESCGGFRVGPIPVCKKGLFCELPGGSCNLADAPGICVATSDICPPVYQPQCGCDGKTYGSICDRRGHQAQLAHDGPCKPSGNVGEMCGGIAGLTCRPGLFCDPTPGQCKVADGGGTCQQSTDACPRLYAPVCGCDGKTYGNDCARRASRVGKQHDGACRTMAMRLPQGQWGGEGAGLLVKDSSVGASIELDCAHGTIEGPLDIGPDGIFKWRGTMVSEGGPMRLPPAPPPPTRGVTFYGKSDGMVMSLQLYYDDGTVNATPYMLYLGKMPLLRKCL